MKSNYKFFYPILILLIIGILVMLFTNMSLPTDPTGHDMFNKMADNLLKVAFIYCTMFIFYGIMIMISTLLFSIYAIKVKYKELNH